MGLIAVAVFALALVLSIAFGGSSLPLELRRAVFPGTVGLACLMSLVVHRPLLVVAATRARRARGEQSDGQFDLDSPGARRSLATLTAIIGVTGVADAAAQIILALTLSRGGPDRELRDRRDRNRRRGPLRPLRPSTATATLSHPLRLLHSCCSH